MWFIIIVDVLIAPNMCLNFLIDGPTHSHTGIHELICPGTTFLFQELLASHPRILSQVNVTY